MRSSVAVLFAAVAALVAGCGQQDAPLPEDDAAPRAVQWRGCTAAAFADDPAPAVRLPTTAGTVAVKLPTDGPCAGGLVARVADGVAGLDVSDLALDPGTAQVVHLRGAADGDPVAVLRVDGGAHPRGGFQPHLFLAQGGVDEVTTDGRPLLPFVATDGGAAPMTATCTDDGGVAVLNATTSEPPGVVLAWDVERSTYRITGAEAQPGGTEQIRDHAADPLLREEMPALFEPGALFADC